MSIQSPAKCEIRGVIRYLVWKEKPPFEIYNEVKTAYGDKAMNCTNVYKWCRKFKDGRTCVHDDQRSEGTARLLHMGGKRFSTDEEVKEKVEKWAKELAENYFEEGIKKLIPRYTTCIERNGDYVEK
ncbi:hypothetical protein RN001_016366 [Aquatica leii]|uniref:Mos1 transposase HTH domain-containing protein n=1 Tax=Aquatica leii TaxID=1421715 RepID=A0AAN7PP42_9COLE|nr:hypothetical protein RN001_016366 [Aquatica leii]